MRPLFFYLCVFATVIAAEISGDLLRMQGTWIVERATRDGEVLHDRKGAKFTFKGDQLSVIPRKGRSQSTPIHLSESASPRKLYIDGPGPRGECKPLNCVYEWADRGLIICMADPDATPKEISDRGQAMYILRREEKPNKAPEPTLGTVRFPQGSEVSNAIAGVAHLERWAK